MQRGEYFKNDFSSTRVKYEPDLLKKATIRQNNPKICKCIQKRKWKNTALHLRNDVNPHWWAKGKVSRLYVNWAKKYRENSCESCAGGGGHILAVPHHLVERRNRVGKGARRQSRSPYCFKYIYKMWAKTSTFRKTIWFLEYYSLRGRVVTQHLSI